MAHYDDPPPESLVGPSIVSVLDELRRADRFRFANHLSAWIEVVDGRITGWGQSGDPMIGSTTMKVGRSVTVAAVPFEPISPEPEVGDGWVRFRQSAGGRTGVPAPLDDRPFRGTLLLGHSTGTTPTGCRSADRRIAPMPWSGCWRPPETVARSTRCWPGRCRLPTSRSIPRSFGGRGHGA